MQGPDADDAACADRPVEATLPSLNHGIEGLRIAVAGGYFRKGASAETREAMELVTKALGVTREIEIPEAERARSAAYVITATEGAALASRAAAQVSRAISIPRCATGCSAGAIVPAALVNQAQKFRRWYRDEVLKLFGAVDIILAPATPCTAPKIGQQTFVLDGVEMPLRPNIGVYTQPISFIGLPVVAAPIPLVAAADRGADHRRAVARGPCFARC